MQQLCLLLICFSTVVSFAITVAWETRRSYSLSRSLINDTEIFRWWLFDDGCSFSCLTCFFWTIITLFAISTIKFFSSLILQSLNQLLSLFLRLKEDLKNLQVSSHSHWKCSKIKKRLLRDYYYKIKKRLVLFKRKKKF